MKAHRTKDVAISIRLTQQRRNLITFQFHDERANPLGKWKIISHYFIHQAPASKRSEERNEIGSQGALQVKKLNAGLKLGEPRSRICQERIN
jgi:hypothetical protein